MGLSTGNGSAVSAYRREGWLGLITGILDTIPSKWAEETWLGKDSRQVEETSFRRPLAAGRQGKSFSSRPSRGLSFHDALAAAE